MGGKGVLPVRRTWAIRPRSSWEEVYGVGNAYALAYFAEQQAERLFIEEI